MSQNTLIYMLPAFLIGIVLHEWAHAFVAWRMGDPTGKNQGRLSLNPLVHLDPIGTLMMFVAGIGWANPVPINSENFRNRRMGLALSAGAGPVMNLLIAAASILLVNLMPAPARDPLLQGHGFSWLTFFTTVAQVNALLAVFNLIPVKPLDGHHYAELVLPKQLFWRYKQHEAMISIVALVLLFAGFFSPMFEAVQRMVYGLCVSSYWGVP